jgi:hypothetical protein
VNEPVAPAVTETVTEAVQAETKKRKGK